MQNVLIIGGSTPLQKLLPTFIAQEKIAIQGVYLDVDVDKESKDLCSKNNIPFYPSISLKKQDAVSKLTDKKIDWMFNINSILILSDQLLNIPTKGSLNFHPGPLPQYAGLHVHQWALRNNEKEHGVTLHWMSTGIDTGNIAFSSRFPIKDRDTGLSLYLKCLKEGVLLVNQAIEHIVNDKEIPKIKQDLSKRNLYTNKMAKDGKINWSLNRENVSGFVRAGNYDPFSSPTYEPYITIDNEKVVVKKIAFYDEIETVDIGAIAQTKKPSIIVGTANGNIEILKVKHEKLGVLKDVDFAEFVASKKLTTL